MLAFSQTPKLLSLSKPEFPALLSPSFKIIRQKVSYYVYIDLLKPSAAIVIAT